MSCLPNLQKSFHDKSPFRSVQNLSKNHATIDQLNPPKLTFGKFFQPIISKDINGTPPKTNMDTQNDGLEKVTPFKHGNCWYLC